MYGLHQRNQDYWLILVSQTSKAFTMTAAVLIVYRMGLGLTVAMAASAITVFLNMAIADLIPARTAFRISPDFKQHWRLVLTLFKQTAPLGLVAFLISLGSMIPRYAEEFYNGPKSLALFTAAYQVGAAVMFIMTAASQAVLPALGTLFRETDKSRFLHVMRMLVRFSSLVAAITFAAALLAGPFAMGKIFGRSYLDSGLRFNIVLLAVSISFVTAAYQCGLYAARRFTEFLSAYCLIAVFAACASALLPLWIKSTGPSVALLLTNCLALAWSITTFRKIMTSPSHHA